MGKMTAEKAGETWDEEVHKMMNKDIRWWNRDIEPRTIGRGLLLFLLFPVVVFILFAIGLFRSGDKCR